MNEAVYGMKLYTNIVQEVFLIIVESSLVGIYDNFSRISPFLFLSMSYQYIDIDILNCLHFLNIDICLLDLFCTLAFKISHMADWYSFHFFSH